MGTRWNKRHLLFCLYIVHGPPFGDKAAIFVFSVISTRLAHRQNNRHVLFCLFIMYGPPLNANQQCLCSLRLQNTGSYQTRQQTWFLKKFLHCGIKTLGSPNKTDMFLLSFFVSFVYSGIKTLITRQNKRHLFLFIYFFSTIASKHLAHQIKQQTCFYCLFCCCIQWHQNTLITRQNKRHLSFIYLFFFITWLTGQNNRHVLFCLCIFFWSSF